MTNPITQLAEGNSTGAVAPVSVKLLRALALRNPIPISISGVNQTIFAVNATKTNPAQLLIGSEQIEIRSALTYTWIAENNTVLNNLGEEVIQTGCFPTASVVYFYVGIAPDGTLKLRPSLSAPSLVEGVFESSSLNHPGVSRSQVWMYVGFQVLTVAVGAGTYLAAEKIGFQYEFPAVSVATTTVWELLDFSTYVPAHGVECSGTLNTSANLADTTEVGSSSTDGRGAQIVRTSAAAVASAPFSGVQANSSGKFYGSSTTAAGTVDVTRVKDIV